MTRAARWAGLAALTFLAGVGAGVLTAAAFDTRSRRVRR